MHVSKIQSQQFEGKERFLSKKGRADLVGLLTKMNNDSFFPHKGNRFDAVCVSSVSNGAENIKDRIMLCDFRFPTRKLEAQEQSEGCSIGILGGKISFWIENSTGKLFDLKKPFHKSWKNILKKYEEFLAVTNKNFDNGDIVHKVIGKEGSEEDFEESKKRLYSLGRLIEAEKIMIEHELAYTEARLNTPLFCAPDYPDPKPYIDRMEQIIKEEEESQLSDGIV